MLPSSLLSFFIFLMAFITTWHAIDWSIVCLSTTAKIKLYQGQVFGVFWSALITTVFHI